MKFKCSKPLLFTAFVHWMLTFATDRIFFEYSLFSFTSPSEAVFSLYAWGIKAAFLLLLILGYQLAGKTIKKYRNNIKITKERIFYTGIYFGLMMVLLLLVYPGAWRMDEFGILRDAKTLMPTFWQGYLTSYFYIFALMLIPIPAGVVIVQNVVISLCVGFVCEKAQRILKLKHKIWLLLPFLAFPVLDSNMYPMRMSVYVFLEISLAVVFLSAIMEKRKLTGKETWFVILLTAVVAVWRTEGIYYMLWIPIVYLITFWKQESKKKKLQFVVATVVVTIVVMAPQSLGNKLVSGDQYEITSMVLPLAPLLSEAQDEQQTELSAIDKVIDVNLMIQGYESGKSGISVFWSEPALIRDNYTSAEYKEFKSAYYSLIGKYPEVFLKERVETFINSNGILMNTTELYDTDEVANYVEFREEYTGGQGIFTGVRKQVLSLLELRSTKDYNEKMSLYYVVYSFLPQLLVLIVAAFYCLIRRKWSSLLVFLGVLGKVPLIFMTAPSLLFMYYYGIYLIGNVVFFYGIYLLYSRGKEKPEQV